MRAFRVGLIGAALAVLAACGASEKMAPASADAPAPRPAPAFSALIIADAGPLAGLQFEHYGVNPTVDTTEQPTSHFSTRADVASFALAQLQMAQGTLPDRRSVRVEDFINAMPVAPVSTAGPAPIATPIIEAFPAPHRPGYHVLRISLLARPRPGPRRVVVLTEASPQRRATIIARLHQIAAQLAPGDEIALVQANGDLALPPTPAGDPRVASAIDALQPRQSTRDAGVKAAQGLWSSARQHMIVFVTDGLAHRGQPSFAGLRATASGHGDGRATWSIVGVGRGPYDDTRMAEMAAATGGRYVYAGAGIPLAPGAFVSAPAAIWDADAQVHFDPAVVTRYRLLGHERQVKQKHRGTGGALASGSAVTALYDVKLAPTAAGRPLGRVELTGVDDNGRYHTQRVSLDQRHMRATFAAASPDGRQALIAASLAEKLRGAWWARGITYAGLAAQLDGVPAALRSPQLAALITQAKALDTRGDQYADRGPIAKMTFDHVPIVRP